MLYLVIRISEEPANIDFRANSCLTCSIFPTTKSTKTVQMPICVIHKERFTINLKFKKKNAQRILHNVKPTDTRVNEQLININKIWLIYKSLPSYFCMFYTYEAHTFLCCFPIVQ